MNNSKLNIDAGIDLYIYGRKFLHYDRKEIGDVRRDIVELGKVLNVRKEESK